MKLWILGCAAIALVVGGSVFRYATRPPSAPDPAAGNYLSIALAADLPDDVKPMIQRLVCSDPMARAGAAIDLRAAGAHREAAIPYLARVLADRTPLRIERLPDGRATTSPATAASGAVGFFTCPGALAARVLAESGEPGIRALLLGIHHKDTAARRNAVDGAGSTKDARVIAALVAALGDEDTIVRERACASLAELGPASAAALTDALGNDNPRVRLGASVALSKLTDAPSFKLLLTALKHPEPRVRSAAASAIAQFNRIDSVAPLIQLLSDESVRVEAAAALAQMDASKRSSMLIDALRQSDDRARAGAAYALAITPDMAATDSLRRLEQLDTSPEVRTQATRALAALKNVAIKQGSAAQPAAANSTR